MTNTLQRTSPPGGGLLSPKHVAAILGVSVATVYRLVESRSIPFFRVAGSLRFDRADVDRYLEAQRVARHD